MGYYSAKLMGMQAEAVSGIVTDGLKLYLDASNPASYPGSGTTWFDLSGNGNNGTMVNGVVPLSNAMQLDGVNDYVSLGDKFNIDANPFTISMWFKLNTFITTQAGQTPVLFWKGYYNTNGYYVQLKSSDINLYTNIPTFKANTFTSSFLVNQWYNVVFAREGSALTAYLNGILIGTSNTFQVPVSNTNNFTIGAYGSAIYGNFATNDFLNYQKKLTHDEVLHNFNATKSKYGL